MPLGSGPGYAVPGRQGSAMAVAWAGDTLLIGDMFGKVRAWSRARPKVFEWSSTGVGMVNSIAALRPEPGATGKLVAVGYADGSILLATAEDGKEVVRLVQVGPQWVAVSPDGFYASSPRPGDLVSFCIDDAAGGRAYGFDEFDLYSNRPDLVLACLLQFSSKTGPFRAGAENRRKQLYEAYRLRMDRYGLTAGSPLPSQVPKVESVDWMRN